MTTGDERAGASDGRAGASDGRAVDTGPAGDARGDRPLIVAVLPDPVSLGRLQRDLRRAAGDRYVVRGAETGADARRLVEGVERDGGELAMVVAAGAVDGGRGVELLAWSRAVFPAARRLFLGRADDCAAALGTGDAHDVLGIPWEPAEEHLLPVVADNLDEWASLRVPAERGIVVVGEADAVASHRLRDLFARNPVPHRYLDRGDPEGAEIVLRHGPERELPLIVTPDGEALWNPEWTDLWAALGESPWPSSERYDLVILGSGPAGLASAVNAASEGLRTLMTERLAPGGQAGTSSRIENYVGFPAGITGVELARRAFNQARRLGAEPAGPIDAERIEAADDGTRRVAFGSGHAVVADAVLLATGVAWNRLDVDGAEAYEGVGLYYGAAMSEARAVAGRDVHVVGGANSAGQAAVYFARVARSVTLLVRGPSIEATMSAYLVEQLAALGNVRVRLRTRVVAVGGEGRLERLTLRDDGAGTTEEVETAALFVLIGAKPDTAWLAGTLARDPKGFVLTGVDVARGAAGEPGWPLDRDPLPFETSLPGVFAVGDVRLGSIKRVSSAVGEGSAVVPSIHAYIQSLELGKVTAASRRA